MSERVITDPSQHGWVLENGKWVWDASSGGAGAGMVISETEPTDKVEGMQWLNPNTGLVLFWDGEKWLEMPGGKDGADGADGADGKQIWDDTNAPDISYTDGKVIVASATANTASAAGTGNVTLDFDSDHNFVVTLSGNMTLDNPTTGAIGQSGFIVFVQGSGGETVSLASNFKTAGGAGLPLSSEAGATDAVPYIFVTETQILLGAPQLGFA